MLAILEIIAVLGALCALAYYGLCLRSANRFLQERKTPGPTSATPPVSILKPLRGADAGLYDCLRSHCQQEYPEYEIICGVSDPDDPAGEVVRRLQSEYPQHPIRLVICRKQLGANGKVSNLAQMLPEAIYDHLAVSDGDILVQPGYLRNVVSPLSDPQIGLVTCLYRAVAGSTLGSRLEALGISTDFAAGVLAARQLEGIRFGLGSTLAFRRRDLEAAGGFEAIVDYLADDYEIGRRVADRGLRVHLSDVVVETLLPSYTIGGFLQHQLRWARTVRDARPGGYAGMLFTFGLPWALLALVLTQGAAWAWVLLAVVAAMRASLALVVGGRVLHDRTVTKSLWLLPLRDLLGLAVWVASFAGHTIAWHGDRFLLRNGRLARAPR